MKYILMGSIAVIVLYLLDTLGLWAERKGGIYYRYKRCSRTAIGNAMLELQTIVDPSKRHVVEERKRIRKEEKDSDDKPQAG
jgi:hypothetical protein